MKILHFADLHIGSRFDRLPNDLKEELETKLRNAFGEIIDYANKNNITTILMSGDIFDKNAVLIKDKKFFYNLISLNSHIDFYYIRGNHDSSSKYNENYSNLHTFNGVESFTKDDVRIIGYELQDDNSSLYNYPSFTNDKFNIMMLHGDIFNSNDRNYINLKKLDDKNISYFALGHIHKRSEGYVLSSKYVYPGSVLGRGFDETGKKGFVELDTTLNTTTFIELPSYEFENIEINVSNQNEAELKNKIRSSLGETNLNKISEIKLSGKSDFEIDVDELEATFNDKRRYLEIKNNSKLNLTYEHNDEENSLRNMFINKVLENKELDEETRELVINYGLSKLMKEEG